MVKLIYIKHIFFCILCLSKLCFCFYALIVMCGRFSRCAYMENIILLKREKQAQLRTAEDRFGRKSLPSQVFMCQPKCVTCSLYIVHGQKITGKTPKNTSKEAIIWSKIQNFEKPLKMCLGIDLNIIFSKH